MALAIGYIVVGALGGLVACAWNNDDEPLALGVTFMVTVFLWPVFIGGMGLAAVAWAIGKGIQSLRRKR